jgi:hypothetical protein
MSEWDGDQPDARPPPTQDNTTEKYGDTHPCLKRDSNSRSERASAATKTDSYLTNKWKKQLLHKKQLLQKIYYYFICFKDNLLRS